MRVAWGENTNRTVVTGTVYIRGESAAAGSLVLRAAETGERG